jgi:putative spermidine/putrescine transport system substrate-binding protein
MARRWCRPVATLAIALAAFGAIQAVGFTPALAQSKTLTISWWGFNGEKLEEIILKPFRAQCGCELVFETGNNADRLNKTKIRGGGGVDVVYLTDSYSQIGIAEGLFQPVDRAKVPNINGIYEVARAPQGKFGPAYTIGRVGIIYDSAKVSKPITSWKDLWRDEFKRRVSLPGITTTAGPMTVLVAANQAGVDPFTDEKAAFAALEKLKPNRRNFCRHGPGFHPGADPGRGPDGALGGADRWGLRDPEHGEHRQGGGQSGARAPVHQFHPRPGDPADTGEARRRCSRGDGGRADP